MNAKRLDTFVVAHDQERLLHAEAQGWYRRLHSPRFVFVGDGPTDRLSRRDDVVVARDLPHHLEDRPELLAFTAWYAVARNGLARAEFVSMLEWDVVVAPDFERATIAALDAAPDGFVGYEPLSLSDPRFDGTDAPLASSLRSAYGIDLGVLAGNLAASTGEDRWNAGSNMSCGATTLADFVDWYQPVAAEFGDDPLGGRVHERCVPIHAYLSGRETRFVPQGLTHRRLRSHGVEVEVTRRRAAGARRLPARAGDPTLSVVIEAGCDPGALERCLRSLAPDRQTGIEADDFEIIVVDEGGDPPLDPEAVRAAAPNVRVLRRGPVADRLRPALDVGVELARGERLGLIAHVDGTASDGLLQWASRAVGRFGDSLVRVPMTGSLVGDERDAVFCTRRRFVGLGGVDGIEGARDRSRQADDGDDADQDDRPSFVTLIGETFSVDGHGTSVVPSGGPDGVFYGSGPVPTPEELEYALLVAADRDRQLAQLRASRSWRMTRPLRGVSGVVRAVTTRRRGPTRAL